MSGVLNASAFSDVASVLGFIGAMSLIAIVGLGLPVFLFRRHHYTVAFLVSVPTALIATVSIYFIWASPTAWYVTFAAMPAALRHGAGHGPRIPPVWVQLGRLRRLGLVGRAWLVGLPVRSQHREALVCWAAWKFRHLRKRYVAVALLAVATVGLTFWEDSWNRLFALCGLVLAWTATDHLAAVRVLAAVPDDELDRC